MSNKIRRIGVSLLLLLGCAFWLTMPLLGQTFTNPIISDGADPWVIFNNGYYYFTDTTGAGVYIRVSTQLAGTNGIGAAPSIKVFSPPAPFNQDVWAPELHVIDGTNYLYYAADDGTNADHRIFCAAQVGQTLNFTFKAKVYDPSTDCWAIDPTVFQATNGALYMIWSGWPGSVNGLQNLYIAPMSNPWTISGPRVLIATPKLSWESWIEEGPEVLQRNGRVFVVFSANESWTDSECLGMLVNSDGNYLNPASWTKMPQPVLQTVSTSRGAVYGPGGSAFTQSLDGTQNWIFYHAATNSGAGWNRNIRMQPFTWTTIGYPNFGQPIPAGVAIANPSGDDYTAPSMQSISPPTNGLILVSARAPLPLLTNQWSVEFSSDLASWSSLTNVPGLQYSVNVVANPASGSGFYRVKSVR